MKKYSNYYIICMVIAGMSVFQAIVVPTPDASALFCVIAFICWYAGVMAPDEEKYKQPKS
jgi:hypothetical protein